jgi:hypothetical protein
MIITITIRPTNIGASTLTSNIKTDIITNRTTIPMRKIVIVPKTKILLVVLSQWVFSLIVQTQPILDAQD